MVKKFSRKGAIQLGVEAVIILIIAIVLLGSIIYFIRSFIGSGSQGISDTFHSSIGCGKTINPSDSAPILPETMTIKLGKLNNVEFCAYNNYGKTISDAKVYFTECMKPDFTQITDATTALQVGSLGGNLDRGQLFSYKFAVKTTSAVTESDLGTWSCKVQISKDPTAISDANPGIGPQQINLVIE